MVPEPISQKYCGVSVSQGSQSVLLAPTDHDRVAVIHDVPMGHFDTWEHFYPLGGCCLTPNKISFLSN